LSDIIFEIPDGDNLKLAESLNKLGPYTFAFADTSGRIPYLADIVIAEGETCLHVFIAENLMV